MQWEMHFAQTSVAVHFCWFAAHLYEEQNFLGVIAVTPACCEPVLQSTTEQWGMHFAQTSAAVYFCWPPILWTTALCSVRHGDLKLENTLLDGRPAPRLKICDFGYSKVVPPIPGNSLLFS